MNRVEGDVVYGVGLELGFHVVFYQCFGVIERVFGDIGESQVVAYASGLN